MKQVGAVLLVFVLQVSVFGESPPDDPTGNGEIREQTERYFDALERHDTKTLEDLLSDEFLALYPRGVRDTKATLLDSVGKSADADEAALVKHSPSNLKVRRLDNTAVATCLLARQRGDGPATSTERTLTWTLHKGRWRLLHDQWSLVGDAREAEYWSDYFRGGDRNFNREANALLADAIEGRRPGKALDVGMGSGRNAIWLAQQGWRVTGIDRAEGALAVARQQAIELGVNITPVLQAAEEFDWGHDQWDLIALLYFHAVRENMPKIRESLQPGGLVVVEAFLASSERRRGGVRYDPGELRELFAEGFTIRHYDEAEGVADYGRERTQLVRLVALKTAKPECSTATPRKWTNGRGCRTMRAATWKNRLRPHGLSMRHGERVGGK